MMPRLASEREKNKNNPVLYTHTHEKTTTNKKTNKKYLKPMKKKKLLQT